MIRKTSRWRFTEYRRERRAKGSAKTGPQSAIPGPTATQRQRSFGTLFWEFLKLLRGYWPTLTFALATLSVATLLKLVPPIGIKLAIDYVLTDQPLPTWMTRLNAPTDRVVLLFAIAGVLIVVTSIATTIHLWGRWYATKTVNRMQVSVRKKVFEHAVRLPLHRVFELKSGGAASMLREDAGGVSELVFSMIYNPWRAILQLIGSLLILVTVDWRMMLAGLVLVPIVYLTHRTWINRIRPLYRDVRSQRQDIDGQATEAFGGMRVVRAFGRERSETGRFVSSNNLLIRQQLFVWWWARLIEVVWALLIPLASTALLVYGGYQILQGQMTLGDLTMFLFYLAMLLDPLATLATSSTAFQNQLAGLDRILDLLDEPSELTAVPHARRLDRRNVAGRLTFRNVGFHYPANERLVLQTIDLEVQPGSTVALVGRSGAGKTTLCNLVARFYDPTHGVVELDGCDLRRIHLDSYRKLLGVVEQEVFLFDGTIAENIGYAIRSPGACGIEQAARAAHAHEFIAQLDQGYDTLIGERGVKLSGGQRQRLAIARALLADPRILILDEATSNLDSESERLIQQSLSVLLANRTCFVIAHRLSTITHADLIVVLEDGRIVESGTHAELMTESGRYRQMVELQTGLAAEAGVRSEGQSS